VKRTIAHAPEWKDSKGMKPLKQLALEHRLHSRITTTPWFAIHRPFQGQLGPSHLVRPAASVLIAVLLTRLNCSGAVEATFRLSRLPMREFLPLYEQLDRQPRHQRPGGSAAGLFRAWIQPTGPWALSLCCKRTASAAHRRRPGANIAWPPQPARMVFRRLPAKVGRQCPNHRPAAAQLALPEPS